MQALVLEEFGRLVVAERPDPARGPDEVLIKVAAVGICGTDVHGFTGENGRRHPGQIMGHEASGHVADADPSTGFTVGQPVTFNPLINCGSCDACTSGAVQHCPTRRVIGVNPEIQAGFADLLAVPAENVLALPEGLRVEHGALIEPLAVAFNAVRRAGIVAGQSVLVIGGGPIGQSVSLVAREAGASTVVVSEINAERRALCERLNATTIDPTSGETAALFADIAGGPADVTIDAVGLTPTVGDALAATRAGGTVVLVGMGAKRLEFGAFDLTTMERSLVGSFCYGPTDFAKAVDWAGQNGELLAELVSAEVSFDQAQAAFEQLSGPDPAPGKILVRPEL